MELSQATLCFETIVGPFRLRHSLIRGWTISHETASLSANSGRGEVEPNDTPSNEPDKLVPGARRSWRAGVIMNNLSEAFRLFGFGVLKNFRIMMTNGFEKMIRQRLGWDNQQAALIGAGIDTALRNVHHYLTGTLPADINGTYAFEMDWASADDSEDILLLIANELKVPMSHEARLGMRFASAIYGLRAISATEPKWTAEKATRLLPEKIALANQLLDAYRKRAIHMDK